MCLKKQVLCLFIYFPHFTHNFLKQKMITYSATYSMTKHNLWPEKKIKSKNILWTPCLQGCSSYKAELSYYTRLPGVPIPCFFNIHLLLSPFTHAFSSADVLHFLTSHKAHQEKYNNDGHYHTNHNQAMIRLSYAAGLNVKFPHSHVPTPKIPHPRKPQITQQQPNQFSIKYIVCNVLFAVCGLNA